MSKLYSRPRTPPSPPSFSQKSSTSQSSRHDSHKRYDEPSKSYSSRDYDKYSSYDKYGKSDKYDRYDKLDKPSYKSSSYLPSKEYSQDYSSSVLKGTSNASTNHSEKFYGKSSSSRSYQDDEPYRSKDSVFVDQSYSDRDSYLSKYPPRNSDKYSKYSTSSTKDISDSKYSKHVMRTSLRNSTENDKKYSPYPPNKSTTSMPYSKYASESNSFYPKNDASYDTYNSYDRGRSQSRGGRGKEGDSEVRGYSDAPLRRETAKSYSNNEPVDSYGGEYQRYVIGDSVVYGSPGHYPKDIYPPSPKSKRGRSPHSPEPLLSASKMRSSAGKSYSRYSSSPKRYSSSSTKGASLRDDSYSRSNPSSSFRKPHSPPPHSYQGLSSHSHSKGDRSSSSYSALPDRGKVYSDRYDLPKGGRFYDQRDPGPRDSGLKPHSSSSRDFDSYRRKEPPYMKPFSSYDRVSNPPPPRDKYPSERPPLAPLMSLKPQPLLSIPLSLSNLPMESRANVRETLGIPLNKPLNGMDKGLRGRRLEGRIGSRKRLPLSPKDRKRRRPDDLRLWIEYRKTEGGKTNGTSSAKGRGQVKRPARGGEGGNRSRLMDSRRRILNKGKKKGGIVRREPRRLLPPKTKSRDDDRKPSEGSSKKTDPSNATTESRSRDEGSKKRKERTKGGDSDRDTSRGTGGGGSGRRLGTTSSARRPLVRRPKVVSQANRLPLKQRPVRRSSYRSSPDKEKSSSKNEKSYHHSTKSKGRERSRSRSRSRSPAPRRTEKDEASSSSRH